MGLIYKIENKINHKVYIGQTSTPLKIRMNKHYSKAKCDDHVTGIDAAIKKYGKENFEVTILCKCNNSQLNDKEIEYIELYDSYNTNKGYNLTTGGDNSWSGLGLIDSEVIQKYLKLKSVKDVAKYYSCSVVPISNILHKHNIKIFQIGRIENIKHKWGKQLNYKPIKIIELNKEFQGVIQCAEWLIKNNYCKAKNSNYVSKGICNALKGKRNSYHKLTFCYL